jgi:arginine/lysine/ornithine decarboxylase
LRIGVPFGWASAQCTAPAQRTIARLDGDKRMMDGLRGRELMQELLQALRRVVLIVW